MANPSQAELQKPAVPTNLPDQSGNFTPQDGIDTANTVDQLLKVKTSAEAVNNRASLIQTPQTDHQQTIQAVAAQATEAGHPITPIQAHPQGEANQILAKIEQSNIGAQVVDQAHDLASKGLHNLGADIAGNKLVYTAEGATGHGIVMNRVAKRAIFSGIAQKIRNLLHWKENK